MKSTTTEYTSIALKDIEDIANSALLAHGFATQQAKPIATTITKAERDGCAAHGLFRLAFYIKAAQFANLTAQATLNQPSPAVIQVNANNGFCPHALAIGLPVLVKKAQSQGIAALAINNAFNIAALWPEVEWLAEQGLVALAWTCANAFVAPAGGTRPLYGTNPMAFAWPRAHTHPLVFDQASSVAARGAIQLHKIEGKPLPKGWAIDKAGNPTTDPDQALQGAQLPFGGYKGSSIALMVELLAGALLGDLLSFESTKQPSAAVGVPFGGELVIAIKPSAFSTDSAARAEKLFAELLSQPGTRLPSARRFKNREVSQQRGVKVITSVLAQARSYLS